MDELSAIRQLDAKLDAIRQRDPGTFSLYRMERHMAYLEPQHDQHTTTGWSLKREPAINLGFRIPQWLDTALTAYAQSIGVNRSDLCRQWIRDGLQQATQDTPLKTSEKPEPAALSPGRAGHTHAAFPRAADPAPPIIATVSVAAAVTDPGPVASEAAPATVPSARTGSLEAQHGARIREIAKGYPRLGTTGSGKLSWDGFADILWKEHGIGNPETGKAFTHHAVKNVVKTQG